MMKGVHIRYDDPPEPPDPGIDYDGYEGEFWEIWVDLPTLPRIGDWMRVGAPDGGALGYGYVESIVWDVELAEAAGETTVGITVNLCRVLE